MVVAKVDTNFRFLQIAFAEQNEGKNLAFLKKLPTNINAN